MRRLFLIAACIITTFSVEAQKEKLLEGAWVLDSVEIRHFTWYGEIVVLPYDAKTYANPDDCIYPTLHILPTQAILTHSDGEEQAGYEQQDSTVTFMFADPVKFTYTILQGNKLLLKRRYNKSDGTPLSVVLSVRIIYSKKKD